MAQYTCLACSVIFEDSDVQRTHYKTDWHRYNLKRKIAELPPITQEEFQKKVEFQTQKKEDKLQDKSAFCKTCNKTFSSDNAYENHVKSKKHKELVKNCAGEKGNNHSQAVNTKKKEHTIKPKPGFMPPVNDEIIEDDSDEWEDIDDDEDVELTSSEVEAKEESEALPQTFCLFCPHESVTVEENLRHMMKSHSFFIPDLQFITDLEAFLVYLGAKVGDGKVCLFCNNHSKQFHTVKACQAHMIDKGHCVIDYEGDAILEYSDFYDFSPTYPDTNDETDIDSELSAMENSLSIDSETLELILPSGARAGHRALKKYYDQNVPPEHLRKRNRAMIRGLESQYKALGLREATLTLAVRKKLEATKAEILHRANRTLALGVKANKLQKYFRKQQMYCG